MSIGITDLLDAVVSKVASSGYFASVNAHEPKNAPGNGLSASVWIQDLSPVRASGLNSTSGRIEFSIRLYTNMLKDPQDDIDENLVTALDDLMSMFSGDFDLGLSNVRYVDLLGANGTPLSAKAGYIQQDSKNYRVMTITLPVIVNDIWEQVS